jgi:hypothetical protein
MAAQQYLAAHQLTVVHSLAAAKDALAAGTFEVVLLDYDPFPLSPIPVRRRYRCLFLSR